jgi:hypothetical protein
MGMANRQPPVIDKIDLHPYNKKGVICNTPCGCKRHEFFSRQPGKFMAAQSTKV